MKKILLLIYMMFPVLVMAQGHKGEVDECSPHEKQEGML